MPQSPKTSKSETQLYFTNTPNIKSEQASTIFNFPAVPSPTTASNGALYANVQSEGKMDVLDVLNVVNVVQQSNNTNVATQSCSSTTNTTNSNCLNVINVNNNAAIFVSQMNSLNQTSQTLASQPGQNQVKDEEIIYETIFIENSSQETIGSFQKVQKMVPTQQPIKAPSGGIIVLTQGSLNDLLLSANTNTNKGTKKFLINNNCSSVDNKNNLQSILMINSTNLNSLNSINSLNSSASNQTFVGTTPTQQSMVQGQQFSNAMMANQKSIIMALNNQQVIKQSVKSFKIILNFKIISVDFPSDAR